MFQGFPLNLSIPFLILLGATCIMLAYHVFLYLQYREPVILKYCLYLLAITLYLVANFNTMSKGEPHLLNKRDILDFIFNFLSILSYAAFIIEAVPGSKHKYKKLYAIWRIGAMACVLYIGFCFFVYFAGVSKYESIIIILTSIMRTMLVLFGAGAMVIFFPLMNSRFLNCIKWGALIYLFFMGLVLIALFLTPDEKLFGLNAMHYVYIGTFSEVVIFSIAMSYKVKELILQVSEVRNRLSRDLHDEIGATLSGLTLMSELVKKKAGADLPDVMNGYIDRMTTESKQMSEKLNDIVWATNPGNDSMEKILKKIQSYASAVCTAKNILLHFNKPRLKKEAVFSMLARNNLYLISKEAINNAVKYSGAGNLWFDLQRKEKEFFLLIRDDGKGFESEISSSGNGLKNMKTRAKEMGAVFNLITGIDKGTAIRLSFI
jgi:signal transduction histidine kinase